MVTRRRLASAVGVASALAVLVARSEAGRLTLSAVEGCVPPRGAVHAANAGAYLVGSLESRTALAARVVLLRRFAGRHAPRADQILVCDVPVFLLEVPTGPGAPPPPPSPPPASCSPPPPSPSPRRT